MQDFKFGAFECRAGQRTRLAGQPSIEWSLRYSGKTLAERFVPAVAPRGEVQEAFSEDVTEFKARARTGYAPARFELIDYTTGDAVAAFFAHSVPDMTPGLIDDRSRYWLRSADRLYSRPVTLSEFGALTAAHQAPPLAWVTGLLSEEVLTLDAAEWRAPTAWEIRHVVGEGSFTGITGSKAAALVGILPQNFRKYTAADGAASRQKMSFAMWHLLLHQLGVQSL